LVGCIVAALVGRIMQAVVLVLVGHLLQVGIGAAAG
jgi:hypothetical protein